MPVFKYAAKDKDSRNVGGKIAAESQTVVLEELRKRQLTIISIQEVKGSGGGQKAFERKKVKVDDVVLFSRQLATMIEAGIPIIQALEALQEQADQPAFRKVIGQVKEEIQHGSTLANAFSKHPQVFDMLFVNMVRVGETGGVLNEVLDRISTYMEKILKLKRKIQSALTYPAVVVTMAIIITTILIVKVVPTFAEIYSSFGEKLPPMTQLLIFISDIIRKYLLWIILALFGFVTAVVRWHKTYRGARVIDGAVLKLPIFGELIRKVILSRFSRTLATLVQSGVPILESLEIVQRTVGNTVVADVVDDVREHVREGESIATPLEKTDVFPKMVTRMISIGEKSGEIEKMLLKVAEFYDDQVDRAVEGLTSIIEPVIIGFLGIVIGFIVIALFMPIMNITQLNK